MVEPIPPQRQAPALFEPVLALVEMGEPLMMSPAAAIFLGMIFGVIVVIALIYFSKEE